MTRYLTTGLLTEGASDAWFLAAVLNRQLQALALAAPEPFDVGDVLAESCRTVEKSAAVAAAAADLLGCCDIVFVHHDANERDKCAALAEALGQPAHLVPLVPIRETEAWMLCDPSAFRGIVGADIAHLPARPKDVESLPDPKQSLAAVARRRGSRGLFEALGARIALDRLGMVPSYRDWLMTTTRVMKELHFL